MWAPDCEGQERNRDPTLEPSWGAGEKMGTFPQVMAWEEGEVRFRMSWRKK